MTSHDQTPIPPRRRHLRSVAPPRAGREPGPVRHALRDEVDLLALIPYTFGFHPHRSLVLTVISESGQPMFARVDIPSDSAETDAATAELVHAAIVDGGRRALLVLYADNADDADDADDAGFVHHLAGELIDIGVEVLLAIRADGQRWWRLVPGSPAVPDDVGVPYDLSSHPITAAGVVEGRVTHRSREHLAETLLPHDLDRLEAVAAAHESLGPLPAGRPALQAEALWVERWTAEQVRGRPGVAAGAAPAEEVARVVRALADPELRDVAWSAMTRGNADRHVRLWTAVVVQCPLDLLAPAAGLLAFAAWLSGHGALAWCAVDRSLTSDPDHTLARLVAETLEGAMPPSVWQPIPRSSLRLLSG